jgi:hypothetical protein
MHRSGLRHYRRDWSACGGRSPPLR